MVFTTVVSTINIIFVCEDVQSIEDVIEGGDCSDSMRMGLGSCASGFGGMFAGMF